MSASSKKKLRKEQESAKLTEKQLTAQREAKKLNLYTTIFVVALVAILVAAVAIGATQAITSSGLKEKNTVAMTIGDHEINNVEMNYFYMDAVNTFYSQYGSYASMFGLDTTKPLNEQVVNEETGLTWADDFLATAKDTAVAAYAMKDAADAAGYTLPEEDAAAIDEQLASLDVYAALYGYPDANTYLRAFYGNGSNEDTYAEYSKLRALADSYYSHYAESLTYDEAALAEAEKANPGAYDAYTYYTYYVPTSKFTEGEAVAAAEEAVKALTEQEITSVSDFDAAIAAMPINEGASAKSTEYADTLYTSINSSYVDWIASSSRKAGDMTYVANESTTTAEDGTESTVINGYYAVYYAGTNDNDFPLANVRHILVAPAHNHADGETHEEGETYSAEELSAAKASAEDLLKQWKEGEATEEAFALLANEHSADGDGTTGGLYENVYPGQMVTEFNDWCFDDARKAGDTGIVETTYGYHVMYYVGDSALTYHDYLIDNELRAADVESWYTAATEAMTLTDGEIPYLKLDLVLSPAA